VDKYYGESAIHTLTYTTIGNRTLMAAGFNGEEGDNGWGHVVGVQFVLAKDGYVPFSFCLLFLLSLAFFFFPSPPRKAPC